MNTGILLCNCHQLDSDYNHSLTFNSRESQWAWFTSKAVYVLNEQMYQRKTELEIRVDKKISQLSTVNYCCILNDDNTKFFYFILEKVYCNEYTTTLFLQLDVIQTHLFSIHLTDCLIERQHVNNWVNGLPNYDMLMEDEGLGTGEYEVQNITEIYNYENKGAYVIEATKPLGIVAGGSGDSSSVNKQNFTNRWLDTNGICMLKHLEGFRTYEYDDGWGNMTTGYGFTRLRDGDSFVWNGNTRSSVYDAFLENPTEQHGADLLAVTTHYTDAFRVYDMVDALVNQGYIGDNWLNQNKFNALISYAYQNGNVLAIEEKIKAGYSDDQLYSWWYNQSEFSYRRQFEANVFYLNIYGEMPITANDLDSQQPYVIQENGGKGWIPVKCR